jgi:hypothetical protein
MLLRKAQPSNFVVGPKLRAVRYLNGEHKSAKQNGRKGFQLKRCQVTRVAVYQRTYGGRLERDK